MLSAVAIQITGPIIVVRDSQSSINSPNGISTWPMQFVSMLIIKELECASTMLNILIHLSKLVAEDNAQKMRTFFFTVISIWYNLGERPQFR